MRLTLRSRHCTSAQSQGQLVYDSLDLRKDTRLFNPAYSTTFIMDRCFFFLKTRFYYLSLSLIRRLSKMRYTGSHTDMAVTVKNFEPEIFLLLMRFSHVFCLFSAPLLTTVSFRKQAVGSLSC